MHEGIFDCNCYIIATKLNKNARYVCDIRHFNQFYLYLGVSLKPCVYFEVRHSIQLSYGGNI